MRQFELLAEALPQIVWICGADGQNIYFNQKWVDYTGLSLEESYGAGWSKPFHPDDQQRALEAWDDAVHRKATYALESRLRRADGEYRWWLVRGVPSMNDDGSLAWWFGTCTDIHDMKLAADELARRESARAENAEDALQLAIEGADLGVWRWHIAEDRLIWSDRTKSLFGLPLDTEMSYARWIACLHPDDRARAEADSMRARSQRALFDFDYRVIWPDGTLHWINAVARAHYDATGQPTRMDGVVRDVSQHRIDQARLRNTNVMFSTAIESMRESIYITDAAGNFTHTNQAFADSHRFPSKAECPTSVSDYSNLCEVSTPDGVPVPLDEWPVVRAFRGESGDALVLTIRRKDTGAQWVGTHGFAPMRDGAGAIFGAVVTARDISEQVRLEESVRASNELVERAHEIRSLALEAGELGAWESTLPDGVLTWTDQCNRLFGLPANVEARKNDLWQAIHAEDRSRFTAAISRSIESGSLFDEDLRILWPDGSIHWLQCVGRAIYRDSEPVRIAGILRRSRSSESRLIAEAIQQMLWIADDSGVTFFNQQWLDYCGATLESHLGYGWIDATHPDDQERVRQAAIAAADPHTTSFEHHYRLRRKDGAYRWCIGRGKKLKLSSDGKPLWYGTTIDVHDLHDALEAAQDANRAKAAFLATTSHELRTPLNAIIGFSTLLRAGDMGPLLDSQKRPLEIVQRSGEELLALVQDILDFTAIEAGSFRMNVNPTPLKGLLGDVRDQLAPRAAERGVELPTVDCDADLCVMADPARLGQAVRNLVANGLVYTDRGYVKILGAVEGGFARIDVIDSGIGIPATELHKLFQAFQQIERGKSEIRRGTGLGLAITRRIVETMGGEVGCNSEPGTGSRFWIKVPLAA